MKQINLFQNRSSDFYTELHGITRNYTELHGITRNYTDFSLNFFISF